VGSGAYARPDLARQGFRRARQGLHFSDHEFSDLRVRAARLRLRGRPCAAMAAHPGSGRARAFVRSQYRLRGDEPHRASGRPGAGQEFRWRGLFGTLLLLLVLGSAAWPTSPYLHDRLTRSVTEYEAYRTNNQPNSTGLHLEFLRKSLSFVEAAPIIGHGTGSIPEQFRLSETGHDSASAAHSENPHNQIFAVAIQLGLGGTAVLIAMWIAHLTLFTGGSGPVAWVGTIVVVQNIVSSLFNSHLFDFTSGWLYVFGVGVVGGMVLRQKDLGKDIPLALAFSGAK